jgi:16S rRNA (guanine527-N7)-methyltransferase
VSSAGPVGPHIPPAPPAARRYFRDTDGTAALARRYARWLAGAGVERGLLGPREVPRLWERHLLNCAAVSELLSSEERVVDVGAGAGLPGIPLGLALPSLHVDLVEPLERRTSFLIDVVFDLFGDGRFRVIRGRAEDKVVRRQVGDAEAVVARAVAPLARLAAWCAPLLAPGGRLLAMKGVRAEAELTDWRAGPRYGLSDGEIVECGPVLPIPTRVVVLVRHEG